MAFATFEQFVQRYGAVRIANAVDGDAVSRQETIEGYLETVSQFIVSAAVEGGFNKPITGAALSPSDPVEAAAIDQVFLDKVVIMMTALLLQQADETKRVTDARASCKDWLEALAMGKGLPVTPPTRASSSLAYIPSLGAGNGVTAQGLRLARPWRV